MKTVPLSPHLTAPPAWDDRRSPGALLVGEIAERLLEWSEAEGRERAARWLMRVATLASDHKSTDAWLLYLRLSTGDLGQITTSFAALGQARHRTKQAEQQEQERALRVIQRHFPELRTAIDAMLGKQRISTELTK